VTFLPWVPIKVDGMPYLPIGLSGNTKDAHWTVFEFSIAALNFTNDGSYPIFIKGIGTGHDISSELLVIVPKVNISGTKTWMNGPMTEVHIQLYKQYEKTDGTLSALHAVGSPFVLSPNVFHVDVFSQFNLPYTDDYGRVYTYSIGEADPGEGYAVSYSILKIRNLAGLVIGYNFTVTNTYSSPKIDVTAKKVWAGGPAPRPTLEFQLYRRLEGGTDAPVEGAAIKQLPSGTTEVTWVNQDKTDMDGKLYIYTVKETTTLTGYITTYSKDKLTVTNSYVIPLDGTATAKKVWVNGPAPRPEVEFELYRRVEGGTDAAVPGAAIKKLLDGTTEVSWTGLERTDINGKEYIFTVKEITILADYKATYSKDSLTVTNSYVVPLDGTVKATKVWVNGPSPRPEVEFELYRRVEGGTDAAVPGAPIKKLLDGTTEATWTALESKDKNGKEYIFTVKEITVLADYETTYSKDNLTVTNSYVIPLDGTVAAKKVWVNGPAPRPEVEFELYRRVEGGTDVAVPGAPIKKVMDGTTEATWTGLERTDKNGKEYIFTVKEITVLADYKATYSEDKLTVTNTYDSPMIDVSGEKTWLDNGEGRPQKITVILKQNGTEIDRMDVMPGEDGKWMYSFDEQDEFDDKGKKYTYSIEELPVEGYVTSVSGYDVENLRVGLTDVIGEKTWLDNGEGRPQKITIILKQNGTEIDRTDVTPDEDGKWMYSFTELAEFDAMGIKYDYVLEEVAVPGYQAIILGQNMKNLRVGTMEIVGEKTWLDNGEGRPEMITVILYRNDEELTRQEVKQGEDGKWIYTFEGLREFDEKGLPYLYSVKEVAIEGYHPTVNDYDIENLRVGIVDVAGEKIWDDLGKRPSNITVYLMRNGVKTEEKVVEPGTDGRWKFSFDELQKFDAEGKAYVYTVGEVPVNGYTTTITGYIITNKLDRGTLRVVKVDDSNKPLAGAVFEIYNSEGKKITGTTNAQGILEYVLPLGTYKVLEVSAPDGYIIDSVAKTANLMKNGDTVIIKVINVMETEEVPPSLPATGTTDNILIILIGILSLGAGAMLLSINKRKKL